VSGITTGPDGNVWFTGGTTYRISRLTPDGVLTEFPLSTLTGVLAGITTGPDDSLWFSEVDANAIGAFGPIPPAPTATPTPSPCTGDCNQDKTVTVAEVLVLVNIALGNVSATVCPGATATGGDTVDVADILTAVNNALQGCPGSAG